MPEIFDDLEIFESWFNLEDLAAEGGSEKLLEEEKKKKVLSTMHEVNGFKKCTLQRSKYVLLWQCSKHCSIFQILSPFMLRRVKSDVSLDLPPKKELVVYAPMTPIQVDLYRAVLDYNWHKLTNKTVDVS